MPVEVAKPPRMSDSSFHRLGADFATEWRGRGKFPPGPHAPSVKRTRQILRDPLPLLLSLYEEYGPIFSMRLVHSPVVFMLGPEANHFVTVAHPENFHWRESSFCDFIPLLGDGLLTIDEAYHDRARAIHPDVVARLQEEQDRVLGGAPPTIDQLERQMPYLEMVLDEVLRLYPPAWIGPRRAVRDFEFGGHGVPRGAYVPFGGGSRICIGKRFGQTEVKLVATMLLQRLRLDALPGRTMTVRQMPTLSPKGGLSMRVLPRAT